MAMVDLGRGAMFPPLPIGDLDAAPAFFSGQLNASNETVGNVCRAPKTGNVVAIWWCTRTVTTGSTMEGRIETVDLTTGMPSGTLFGANTNGTLVVADTDDNLILEITLTAAAAVTAGDLLAVLIKQPAASFGDLIVALGTADNNNTRTPYGVSNVSGSYLAFTANPPVLYALEYDDGSIEGIDGVHPPASAITSTALSTSTTPDVGGLRFQLAASCRVRGAWIWMDLDGNADVNLVTDAYVQGTSTGVLTTVFLDSDVRDSGIGGIFWVTFPDAVTLSAATNYRLIVEPTTTTSLTLYDFTTASLALMNAWPAGAAFYFTTAKDPTGAGDWTNYNSGTFRQPYMGLIVDGVDVTPSTTVAGAFTFVG